MILHLLEEKGAESILYYIVIRVCIILICWLFMISSIIIDFWSGTSTAKALGEPLHSRGFRQTIAKTGDYVRVMVFAIMFDALGICFIPFYILPFFTILGTIAIMIIEGKSVIENSKRKKAHAAEIPKIVKEIIKAGTVKKANEILQRLNAITNENIN